VEDAADDHAERLKALFRTYVSSQQSFRTALSGGYDSRLILALLLDAGVDPDLYVYGAEGDPDVVVAKEIARGEGLRLRHVDKGRLQGDRKGSPERAWARFDSWKVDGLFDSGIDDEDRKVRAQGADVLNGSGGECFRNFFYLRDGHFSPEEIVWSFYSQYDPSHVTSRFRPTDYASELAQDMRLALPNEPRAAKLDRAQVEALYPLFRVRYWTGRDVGLNQRFGPLLFPFLEPSVFSGTERVPIGFKDHGRLEALILRKISPRLARYMSSYGFPLSEEPPLRYRLKMALTLWRPPYLRQFSYRVRARLRPFRPRPQWFIESLEAAHLNPTLPVMSEFFRIGQISDMDVLNRVATAEFVFRGGPWPLQADGTWPTDPVDVSRRPA
jgi:asparagine synthase (glutamine-hydrolysing)